MRYQGLLPSLLCPFFSKFLLIPTDHVSCENALLGERLAGPRKRCPALIRTFLFLLADITINKSDHAFNGLCARISRNKAVIFIFKFNKFHLLARFA